ncbi:methyltransferase domain-containing protein [bacterium]|nr:methyltransferase domain-containing protein [bacterium]
MRYGIRPDNLPEHLALLAKQVPLPVVDTLLALLQARGIMAAVKLGLFEAMREERSHSAAELAGRMGCDAPCLELLLRQLVSSGYMERRPGGFSLSAAARRWLLRGSQFDLSASVLFCFHELRMLDSLEELIRSGRGLDFHSSLEDPEVWQVYQRSMFELARGEAPHLAGLVQLAPGARLLLDIAGSHGYLGAELCRRNPPLKSIVLDLPAALPHARALAQEAGITDVVEHREGNMLAGEFPGPADAVLLSNILHHFSEAQIIDILKRGLRALNPGGSLLIWDAERRADNARPDIAGDALALWFRLTSESQVYEDKDYVRFMKAAGFSRVKVKRSILSPVMVCVQGQKAQG